MVSAHHGGRGRERVGLPEDGVGGRDRHLRHHQAVVHVPEVDDAHHLVGARARSVHERVPVVGVAVDHAPPEAGEGRAHPLLEEGEEALGQGAPFRKGDVAERPAEEVRPRQVPLELAVCFGVGEVGEGPVQRRPGRSPGSGRSSRVRGFASASGVPFDPGQEEGQAVLAPREGDRGHGLGRPGCGVTRGSVSCGARAATCSQGRDLEVHEAALPRRVHDLQHERAPVARPRCGSCRRTPREGARPRRPGRRGLGRDGRPPRGRAALRVPRASRPPILSAMAGLRAGRRRGPRVRGERRRAKLRQT